MTAIELKASLLDSIQGINDKDLIEKISQYVSKMLAKARSSQNTHYKLKNIDELHPAVRNFIGIAKGAEDSNDDLNGRMAVMQPRDFLDSLVEGND
jgi:hypothetical protein